ncbi:MAG: SDR family oxidoreductase [Acidobacteria bacterium]|nr:SDR family oxidoreductase [Acidobacteriota bacterium]MCA1609456.1 SDR family oxidoreductase [Acidobacteriota bacterium]
MADLPLSGRGALVTGAGIRVGRAIALALAVEGADVAVHYRSSASGAEEVCATIRALGRRAAGIAGDLAEPAECERVVAETERVLGGLDLLVHSASNFHRASIEETTPALWDSALNVNARSGFLLSRAAAAMLRRRAGRIVLISDFLAARPVRNYLAHSVSKAAVEGLVRALAIELAPEVSVNGVAPGVVLPPDGTFPEDEASLAKSVPARRNGTPEDVAQAVVFLCSGPAFITGQILRVDGGRVI